MISRVGKVYQPMQILRLGNKRAITSYTLIPLTKVKHMTIQTCLRHPSVSTHFLGEHTDFPNVFNGHNSANSH